MEKTTARKQKEDLLSLLEGYKKANELIAAERKKRLSQMTSEDSIHEYDHLCRLYAVAGKKGLEILESQRIIFLEKRRRLFNRIGRPSKNR